ncbi:hypothetical protein JJD41_05285 [Oxynema sp. CENA135]|nr:hypothetical protein [Oxynema sp. CENA135]MBK4729300.1 hypothetical protein [Oxynema sp. CENA135]
MLSIHLLSLRSFPQNLKKILIFDWGCYCAIVPNLCAIAPYRHGSRLYQ